MDEKQKGISVKVPVTLLERYSFTMQFLFGARWFVSEIRLIEAKGHTITSGARLAHASMVCAAVMQSVAALESEAFEIITHGPGNHRGSSGMDEEGRRFLAQFAEMLDRLPVLERMEKILLLLRKAPLDRSGPTFQNMSLVLKFRNEIVHYKSEWDRSLELKKFVILLKEKGFTRPQFIPESKPIFPNQVLNAECAEWCFQSAVNFLTDFHERLGFPDRMSQFKPKGTKDSAGQ